MYKYWLLSFFFCLGIIHCLQGQSFTEVSGEMGLTHGFGIPGQVNGQVIGGGISFSDFNQDGWDDITVATLEDSLIHFYQSDQGTSFLKLAPLVNCDCRSKQILWADVDNDGDKDLFVSCYVEDNRLYENTGGLTMVDRTATSGINLYSFSPSTAATMGDYDNDGLLDLYVGEYTNTGFNKSDRLFKNNGDFTYTDVTAASGIPVMDNPTLACSFQDINHDLKPEIYVAVDKAPENKMYKNNGDGTFSDISASSNTNIVICAMNSSSGDIENDGDLDIYVTNAPAKGGNALLQNNNDETFTDITAASNVLFGRVGWGTSFFDCENDGDLDMYVSGSVNATNALYLNDGSGVFSEPLYSGGGISGYDDGASYCNIRGDFNHDGLEDLLVSNQDTSQLRLWRNDNQSFYNWIKVDLEGTVSNKDGIGVWISAYADPDVYTRYTNLGDGYLGQNSDFTLIGLLNHTQLDSLIIEWPSGTVDKFEDIQSNQFLYIKEGMAALPCPLVITQDQSENLDGVYSAQLFIKSAAEVSNSVSVDLLASQHVELVKGFNVTLSSELLVDIPGCTN